MFKVNNISEVRDVDALYFIKTATDTEFSIVVTDAFGAIVNLKDLQTPAGIQGIASDDGTIEVTGGNFKNIRLSATLVNAINSALKPGDNISDLINDAGYLTSFIEADPIFQASEASNFVSGDKANLDNQSGVNTGDETTSSIQSKRPLKTIDNKSLEGTGNIEIDYNTVINKPTSFPPSTHTHPISDVTGLPTALDDLQLNKEDKANKNIANGYAGLDSSGKIIPTQLPALAITDTFVVNSQAEMLALVAEVGDVAVRTDLNKSFILISTGASTLANWQELLSPTSVDQTIIDGSTNAVSSNAVFDGLALKNELIAHLKFNNADKTIWNNGYSDVTTATSYGEGAGGLASGSNWTANGFLAGYSNTTGSNWTANGLGAGFSNTTGSNWTANGSQAGYSNTTGSNWTANGYRAGGYLANGTSPLLKLNNGVFIGADTKALEDNSINETVIGYNATGLGSNSSVIGNSSTLRSRIWGRFLSGTSVDDGVNQLQVAGTISASPATTANQVVVKSQLDAESDSQIEISTNSNTLDAWNKKTILFTANCTITVPATLLPQFGFVFRTLAGVTVTWQITAPFTWETTPTTTPEKTTGSFMRRGNTNTILLDF